MRWLFVFFCVLREGCDGFFSFFVLSEGVVFFRFRSERAMGFDFASSEGDGV